MCSAPPCLRLKELAGFMPCVALLSTHTHTHNAWALLLCKVRKLQDNSRGHPLACSRSSVCTEQRHSAHPKGGAERSCVMATVVEGKSGPSPVRSTLRPLQPEWVGQRRAWIEPPEVLNARCPGM